MNGAHHQLGTQVASDPVANAWGVLLADAPRLAKAIHDLPGSAGVLAKVFNSFELISRITGLGSDGFGRRFRATVETDVPNRRIVVKLR